MPLADVVDMAAAPPKHAVQISLEEACVTREVPTAVGRSWPRRAYPNDRDFLLRDCVTDENASRLKPLSRS